MLHPVNVATPATAALGFPPVQVSVPPPGLVVSASVTDDVSVSAVFPATSFTVTTGCVEQATPPVHVAGVVVNTRLAPGPVPVVTFNLPVVAAK